jgi:prepilin-type processing-associated H-X9-DG protein
LPPLERWKRAENQALEKDPITVSARQAVDVGELTQIAAAIGLYAKMNGNNLPAQFADLKHYTTADVFPSLETNRFELLHQGKLTDIANPVSTPLVRARAKDRQNQRPYLFADGHLEIREE